MPPTEGLTDGKAAIPLYQQVIDIIKNEINSGAYKAAYSSNKFSMLFRLINMVDVLCNNADIVG